MTFNPIKSLITSLILLVIIGTAAAQSATGQICVRSFEDRNGNSTRDAGEPFLTRSIGAGLADAEGIIIQSLLLDDSPQASAGTMCFQNLEAGNYMVTVISADYNATTSTTFASTVTETSIPQVLEYGGQSVVISVPEAATNNLLTDEARQQEILERLFWSVLGAGVVMGIMLIIGAILAFIFFRGRRQPEKRYPPPGYAPYAPPGTGAMRPIDPATGQFREYQSAAQITGDTGQVAPIVDANQSYMPPRQDRLDTNAMQRFTLEESRTQPPVTLNDATMSEFVLDDDDTGQSAAINVVSDDAFKPPVDILDEQAMSDFVLDDEDTGQSPAIQNDDDTGQSAAIRDDDTIL